MILCIPGKGITTPVLRQPPSVAVRKQDRPGQSKLVKNTVKKSLKRDTPVDRTIQLEAFIGVTAASVVIRTKHDGQVIAQKTCRFTTESALDVFKAERLILEHLDHVRNIPDIFQCFGSAVRCINRLHSLRSFDQYNLVPITTCISIWNTAPGRRCRLIRTRTACAR